MEDETVFKRIFSTIDNNGDGTISETEVSEYFKALGLKCSQKEVAACLKLYDTDGNGAIDMDEFVSVTKKACHGLMSNDKSTKDMFQGLFGGEGIVTEERLQEMFKVHGYNPSSEEVKDLLQQADSDFDGEVTFEEFILKMALLVVTM